MLVLSVFNSVAEIGEGHTLGTRKRFSKLGLACSIRARAPVVSDEQNEIKKFKNWGLDIIPHRKRMKDGFTVKEVVGAAAN